MERTRYQQELPEIKEKIVYVDTNKYIIASEKHAEQIAVILGSCVGIAGYNTQEKKGFATHILEPKTGKEMIEELIQTIGKNKHKYEIYLSGGNKTLDIEPHQGKKNIEMAEEILQKNGIYLKEENKIHILKNQGNKIILDLRTGKLENKIIQRLKPITQE